MDKVKKVKCLSKPMRIMATFYLLCIFLVGCAKKTDVEEETLNASAVLDEEDVYQIVERLVNDRPKHFISVLSYTEDAIEAFAVYPYEYENKENRFNERGKYIEVIEILHITHTEEGWEIGDRQSGTVYTNYFDTDMTGQIRQDIDETVGMSTQEAYDIAAGLYDLWADFDYRFVGVTITGAESFPGDGYDGYVVYPKELFTSLEEIRTQLEQILTPGCVEQFWEGWITEREFPYYIEQDGVLYRYDTGSPAVIMEADMFVLREYTEKEICVYAVEAQSEFETSRSVFKMTIINTEEGWRIGQLDYGYVDSDSGLE